MPDEIIIKIKRKRKLRNRAVNEVSRPPGILRSRHVSDYEARRNAAAHIRFFDLRYYRSAPGGGFSDLGFVNRQDTLTAADYLEFINTVFSIGLDKFKNSGELINDFRSDFQADGYFPFFAGAGVAPLNHRYFIFDSLRPPADPDYNTKWSRAGLKLTADELSQPVMYLTDDSFVPIYIKGTIGVPANKITLLSAYESPAVIFEPTGKMDVFVVPTIFLRAGRSRGFVLGAAFDRAAVKYRSVNFASLRYDRAGADFRHAPFWVYEAANPLFNAPEDYAKAYRSCLIATALGVPRMNLINGFPPPPLPPRDASVLALDELSSSDDLSQGNPRVAHRPLYIIRQDGQIYYVWSND